ncbi:MAG: hypothetical protein LIR50_10590 [Bacillota bacterium]|nr:hypothetical protein [Bacillota bacterium]
MPTIYNKVVIDGSTLMDISDTTAVATDVASGKYFYAANGTKTAGTASGSSGSSGQTVTGTVTGNGTTVLQIPCNFEPDLIHLYGDLSGDVSLRGVTILTIIKDVVLYQAQDGSSGSVNESSWFIRDITGYNESDTVNTHASYSNGTLTIDTISNSAAYRFAEGITYNYELSTIGTGGGGSSAILTTKTITLNGTYDAEDDSADGYSEVIVNVQGGASMTEVSNTYGTELVIASASSSTPSATRHTLYFEYEDETSEIVYVYYDDAIMGTAITSTIPTTHNNKTVTSA